MTRAKRIEEAARRAAERMVLFVPSEISGDNGSLAIGPNSEGVQGWELLTLRPDAGLPQRAEKDIRQWIAEAITALALPEDDEVAELREAVMVLGKEVAAAWKAEGITFGHGEEIDAHPIASAAVKGKL